MKYKAEPYKDLRHNGIQTGLLILSMWGDFTVFLLAKLNTFIETIRAGIVQLLQ
jgi:hypothetical protein